MNILNLLLEEEEDRKRREDLKYVEKTKGKNAEKIVDRVIVELTGSERGTWLRGLRRWKRLDDLIKKAQAKQVSMQPKFKDDAIQLFAAQDEVLTRVVEVAEFTLTLKKQIVPEDKVNVEYEAVVKELQEAMPELEEKLKELIAKYTVITKGSKPEKPAMTIGVTEGLIGDAAKAFKKMATDFLRAMKLWGKSFDKKLNALKKRAAKLA